MSNGPHADAAGKIHLAEVLSIQCDFGSMDILIIQSGGAREMKKAVCLDISIHMYK